MSIENHLAGQTLWPDHCVRGMRGAEFHPARCTMPRAELILRRGIRPEIPIEVRVVYDFFP